MTDARFTRTAAPERPLRELLDDVIAQIDAHRTAAANGRHAATANRLPFPLPTRDLPQWERDLLATIPGRHRLELDGDNNGQLPAIPATYLDSHRGWVREVPGTWNVGSEWFMVELVATGEVIR